MFRNYPETASKYILNGGGSSSRYIRRTTKQHLSVDQHP